MGQWLAFPVPTTPAKGVYLEVTATVENEHGPVIYELQARGLQVRERPSKKTIPSQIVVPLGGVAGEELFVLGNVGAGFDAQAKAGATSGQYVLTYESGHQDTVPLVVGKDCPGYPAGKCILPRAGMLWSFAGRSIDRRRV